MCICVYVYVRVRAYYACARVCLCKLMCESWKFKSEQWQSQDSSQRRH